ncbi:hypothetical protein GN956_G22502 [Arapaima gigas]
MQAENNLKNQDVYYQRERERDCTPVRSISCPARESVTTPVRNGRSPAGGGIIALVDSAGKSLKWGKRRPVVPGSQTANRAGTQFRRVTGLVQLPTL